MKTSGVDIIKKHQEVNYKTIEEALPQADIVVCSMDLNKTNHNYFNYNLLKKAKKGVIFINVARG